MKHPPARPKMLLNITKNAYLGFHFDGPNNNTGWEGNEMCTHWAGMALTNSAVIGTQGSPTWNSNNWWMTLPSSGCDPWGIATATLQTYCEDSDADQSLLYVRNAPTDYNPIHNGGNTNPMNYTFGGGPSTNLFVTSTLNGFYDCVYDPMYPAPPLWRTTVMSVSAIRDKEDQKVRLYPNPARDYVSIESLVDLKGSEIRIISLTGTTEFTKVLENSKAFFIDVSFLNPSLYIFQIRKNNELLYTQKLILID